MGPLQLSSARCDNLKLPQLKDTVASSTLWQRRQARVEVIGVIIIFDQWWVWLTTIMFILLPLNASTLAPTHDHITKHKHKKNKHVPFLCSCCAYVTFVSSENEDEISQQAQGGQQPLILHFRVSLCLCSGILTCFWIFLCLRLCVCLCTSENQPLLSYRESQITMSKTTCTTHWRVINPRRGNSWFKGALSQLIIEMSIF